MILFYAITLFLYVFLYTIFLLSYPQIQYLMPNLYPGIKPFIGSGRPYSFAFVVLFTITFFPFLVFAQPVITGFTPQSGPVGTTVTISGSNFGATPANNIVFFGSVKATITAASSTSLTVTAPPGISFQPLTVTAGNLTAFSNQPFITTFTDPAQFKPDAFSTRWDITTGDGPQSIFTIDFDGDGKTDIVVADADSNTVEVYRNTSTGGVISFALAMDYLLPNYAPSAVTAGDLDGDGKPEIVLCNINVPKLVIFRNTSSSGTISMAAPVYYNLGTYTTGVTLGDCNKDGKPEIIAANAADNVISVYPNNSTPGNLNFAASIPLALPSGTLPWNAVITDFDGDGMPDIASVNGAANSVSIFHNIGAAGGAISFDNANIDFSVGSSPQNLTVGDLDGDGKPDLAVVNNGDATITILQNASTPGTMNFNRGTDVPTGAVVTNSPWALIMTDLDGDGKPDIASVNQQENTVSIHRNISTAGSPAIDANVDYATGYVPDAIISADFDGDGMPDLAITNANMRSFTILRNKSSNEPAITSFTPTYGPGGTVVTITGNNLTGATAVSFGGVAATTFTVNSATTITATVGSGASGVVSVTTPYGIASLGTFTWGSTPIVTSFTPSSGSPGATITINGSNFTGATNVTFGTTNAASFTIISDNQITAIVGNGSSGAVRVTKGSGYGELNGFSYVSPPISISSFSPQSQSQGLAVYIKGHGFLTAQNVTLGGVPATIDAILGDTAIRVIVGTGATGSVAVSGTNGSDSQPGFTFVATVVTPPSNLVSITSFTPLNGTSGDTVYIYGTNLTTVNSVSFGGTPALYYRAIDDGSMFAVIGAGSTGFVKVVNNTNADSLRTFTYTYDSTKLAPVAFQLIQFSGVLSGSNIPKLQWQVKNDAGISFYAVERSSDSLSFYVIDTVKSTRSNGSSHSYSYTDGDAGGGTNWYRLKMQDTTASYTYSTRIRLQPVSQTMPVYPNPVKYGFFFLDVPDVNSSSQITLVDMSGKELQNVKVPAGLIQVRVNVPGLAKGTYRVSWTNGKRTANATILILQQ
jgi:hypothetical protein